MESPVGSRTNHQEYTKPGAKAFLFASTPRVSIMEPEALPDVCPGIHPRIDEQRYG